MNLSAFKGKMGICRLISLVAGFLVFVLVIAEQFCDVAQGNYGGVIMAGPPPVNWFGLFGFIDVLFYLGQLSWAGLLIMDVHAVSDARTLKLIDGGINGVAGGVIAFLCIWWLVLLVFTFWEVLGTLNCDGSTGTLTNCHVKMQLGFAASSWIFAAIQGISSILLGVFIYKEISKEDGREDETPAATDAAKIVTTVSSRTKDAESLRTPPP